MRRPSIAPGILLGIGLGGFLDGIVLHQILQWHHMLSAEESVRTVDGLETNTLADGLFHAATWLITLAGTFVAVRAWRAGEIAPPWSFHIGAMLLGWGLFNFVESADHLIVGIHHVRDDLGGPVEWDIGFLLFAIALIAAGLAMTRREVRSRRETP